MKLAGLFLILAQLALCLESAAAPEDGYFDADGSRLHFRVDGTGPAVVLLHGFSGSIDGLWVKPGTSDRLVAAGYRVIALDQRGHGQSEKPHEPDAYGTNMAEDVRRLLDHLHIENAHIVGYSMGAKVTNKFRELYPARVQSIVLGGYGWPWSSNVQTVETALEQIQKGNVLPGNDLHALAAVRTRMNELTPAQENLETNKIPGLAIIGDADAVVPDLDVHTLKRTMANLELVIMPGTHAGPDGAPYKAQFAEEIIEFLARQSD